MSGPVHHTDDGPVGLAIQQNTNWFCPSTPLSFTDLAACSNCLRCAASGAETCEPAKWPQAKKRLIGEK